MTTIQPAQLRASSAQTDENGQSCCAACDHPLTDHDPIGRRYCLATQQHLLARGCICRRHS